ncbi:MULTISPECIES: nitroreductase family protein [Subtercola]|uniref:Putative NAD(P)H nitroreductase n=1 Tax=Subtercola vilae TaxID=2056433 RepID=A0A4T2BPK9_9MICO|nr:MULTISPECIES: nitroreductase family protein [Subtercola]MEA9987041.1 nitroreductase family protein [Subtercola sp. RTI3]TIH32712.1 nitroreductase [Subtercola vilae]
MSALDSLLHRRSVSKVGASAPSHRDLFALVEAAGTVADHSSLRPWRLIELRGAARDRLGHALADAEGPGANREKLVAKMHRAPLLIALVVVHQPSAKVPYWEQEAVASGVAHALSLLLDEAGWGVMWRTGQQTRSEPVRQMHELRPNENLLGWLYVGDAPPGQRELRRKRVNPMDHLTEL